MVMKVDKLLLDRPELRERFVRMAGDPGVSGDVLMRAMNAAGIPAKRSAVFNWQAQFKIAGRHRSASLAARVAKRVMGLGREQLYDLADQLGVPINAD